MDTPPLQDQLANVSPVWVVIIVAAFTLVRLVLAKVKDNWARTVSETCDTINFVLILAFLLIRPFVAQAFYIPSESMESTLLVGDRLIVNKFAYRLEEPKRGDVIVFEAPPNAPGARPGQSVDYIKRLIALPGDRLKVKRAKITLNGQEVDSGGAENLHEYLRGRLSLRDEIVGGKRLQDGIKIFSDRIKVIPADGAAPYDITKERVAEMLGQPGASIVMTPATVYLNDKPLKEEYTREDPDYDYPDPPETEVKIKPGHLFVMGDNRNHSADSHAWGQLERNRVVGKAVWVFWPPSRFGAIK